MTHEIPRPLFEEFCEGNSAGSLMNNKVGGVFAFQNKWIVITGSISMGMKRISCCGYEVIPIELYKGIEPLSYNECSNAGRKCYEGQGFTYKRKKYVFNKKERFEFKPTKKKKEVVQLGLF